MADLRTVPVAEPHMVQLPVRLGEVLMDRVTDTLAVLLKDGEGEGEVFGLFDAVKDTLPVGEPEREAQPLPDGEAVGDTLALPDTVGQ